MKSTRDIGVIMTGRVLQVFITLVAVRAFTHYLSKPEVGNLYLMNAIVGFFLWTMVNPVGAFMLRRTHGWAEQGSLLDHFFLFNFYMMFVAALSMVLIAAGRVLFHIGSGIDLLPLVLFVAVYLFLNTWYLVIIPTLNVLQHRVSFVVFTFLAGVGGLVLSILMVRSWEATALMWLAGQVIAQAVVTIAAFWYFKKVTNSSFDLSRARSAVNRANLRGFLTFVVPLALTTFLLWSQNQSYRLIIENRQGLEFVGMIGLGTAIAIQCASAVESIVVQLYFPLFYSEINTFDMAQRTAAWNRLAHAALPMYVSLTLFVSCFAPFLITLLASEGFSQAWHFVMIGSWIELFRMTATVLSSVAHAEMHTKYLIKPYAIGSLFTVVGVYIGSHYKGYEYSIPAVLALGGLLTTVIMYHAMRKLARLSLGVERLRKSFLLSLPFGLAVFVYRYSQQTIVSIVVTGIAGLYFLLVQYILYRNSQQAGPA